jgi:23S rRNA (cytidine1920-2'-O)/16S rRNA (cytidine1409-2'-O)-methyltransferase
MMFFSIREGMAPVSKSRLDKLMVERGLCETRAQAQALVMEGKVRVNGDCITKPGTLLAPDKTEIQVTAVQPYVSRGGLKLEKALDEFGIPVEGRACIDVGASTGGFTDCLLRRGAAWAAAVDVGYGQLDWKLRNDTRVQVLEKTNIRYLKPEQLAQIPSLGVVDTSFISLKKVLPPLSAMLAADAEMMVLLKPQFEYKDYVTVPGFHGVVRGADKHQGIVEGLLRDLDALLPEWRLVHLEFSPITGPKGNIEFLLHWARGACLQQYPALPDREARIGQVITESYETHGL